jgi:DNA-binding NtrC family response regulator
MVGMGELHFVVVENDADLRQIYVRKLEQTFRGCQVFATASCAAALEFMSRVRVDAVIVNQRASDAEGVALIEAFYAHKTTVPIIAVGESPLRERALQSGAAVFVDAKDWASIGLMVREALRLAGRQTELPPPSAQSC